MKEQPLLDYIEQYVQLTKEEQQHLISKVRYRKYLKGQYVTQQGDVCQHENFVISGCLKSFYVDEQGNEHIVMFAIENWWTADIGSFISQTPADYNVQCLENTEVVQFSFDNIEQLYIDIPKLERFFRIITQKGYAASLKRIINNFSLSAKDRYLNFRKQYPQMEQKVPQYLIASYLGITKEFLSKIKGELITDQK